MIKYEYGKAFHEYALFCYLILLENDWVILFIRNLLRVWPISNPSTMFRKQTSKFEGLPKNANSIIVFSFAYKSLSLLCIHV
jgi:hypothetical protein